MLVENFSVPCARDARTPPHPWLLQRGEYDTRVMLQRLRVRFYPTRMHSGRLLRHEQFYPGAIARLKQLDLENRGPSVSNKVKVILLGTFHRLYFSVYQV